MAAVVAITRLGAVTGHGLGTARLHEAIVEGRTAIRPVSRFSTEGLCSGIAAEAPSDRELIDAAGAFARTVPQDRASRMAMYWGPTFV